MRFLVSIENVKLFIRVWLGFSSILTPKNEHGNHVVGWVTAIEDDDDDDHDHDRCRCDDDDGGRRRGNLVERFRSTDASVARRFG